ncbi:hypothetical protein FNV43_RR10186 [Rhamnella rubrinervis]|uniref:Zinc finger PHD-type domain-containing protein n=1 Tax=Rhamnella rubrinervis TaxID=2594499 RepID=A0A8K0HCR9_9ROSA|nr:hypothetical protein FNV43_RR10186 [Rhamnella rubrinervis]
MRKVKFKTVKELYGLETQMTTAKDGCPRSVNEADGAVRLKMESSISKNQIGGNFPSGKFQDIEESGTCNMRTAIPVSPRMNAKQVASLVGIKTDELSDEAFKGKADVLRSFGDADILSPSLSSTYSGRHFTGSETSNLLSACSSHDSFSGNSESKATLKASGNSEDCGVHVATNIGQTDKEISGVPRSQVIHQSEIFLNQLERSKKLECLGDNISRSSGSDYTNLMVGDRNDDADMKRMSCGSASVNGFTAMGNTSNNQSVCCGLASSHSDEMIKSSPKRPISITKDFPQEIEVLSNKSNESDVSSLTNSYPNPFSKMSAPELSEEQVESSVTRTLTFGVGELHGMHNHGESAVTVLEMNQVGPEIEASKCSDQRYLHEKSDVMVREQEHEVCLQSNSVNYNGGSDILEDEVKVCDICGDAGREDLLATCSMCIDGAEHIYCMHEKLDKIPEGNWICEECKLLEESEKARCDKFIKTDGLYERSFFNELRQNSGNPGTFSFKNNLGTNTIVSGVEESSKEVDDSTSHFSVKRSAGSLEVLSVAKRRAFETSTESPRLSTPRSKTLVCRDNSNKNLNKREIRATHAATCGDQSFESTKEYPSVSAAKSTKFHPRSQVIQGSLFKSKSFEGTYSKKKGKLSDGSHVQKQKFCKDAAASDHRKKETARMMCKSLSFNSDHSNTSDSAVNMLSHFDDLKKSKHASEENTTQRREYRSKLGKPFVSSTMDSSGGAASDSDKKLSSNAMSVHLSGSKCQDLKDDHENVDSALKGSKYLNNEENKAVNIVKKHVDLSTEASNAIRENNSHASRGYNSNSIRENNTNATFPSDGLKYLRSSLTIPYPVSVIPHPDYIWKGGIEISRNGRSSSSCYCIQAHMSIFASPKVHEVVHRLPQKILVEEVPRLSTWPTQFPKDYATEDNVALYFFAEDLESYRRKYKTLLEFLINKDLALKANLDGVELLIFPSNLLPEKFQRWNALLYLWGVFRGRGINYSESTNLSGVLPRIDSNLKRKRDTKERQEIENKVDVEDSKDQHSNSTSVEGETECKRTKSCEKNSSGYVTYPDDGFLSQKNGNGSRFSSDGLGCGGAYDMFVPTEKQVLTINNKGQPESVEKRVLTINDVDQSNHGAPNLELSLGSETSSMKQKKYSESKSRLEKDNSHDYADKFSPSLSLSLALPCLNEEPDKSSLL